MALAPNPWSCYGDERIAFLVDRLSEFDILIFQEVFKGFWGLNEHCVAMLERALEQRGFLWHVHGPQDTSTSGGNLSCCVDGGLAIYSRFPATQASTHVFSRGVHVDWFAAKGAVHLKVEVTAGRFVHVVSAHLQASYSGQLDFYPGTNTRTYHAVRQAQVEELRALIHRVAQDGAPVLFCGDLNSDAMVWDRQQGLTVTTEPCEFGQHLACLRTALKDRALVDVVGRDFVASTLGVPDKVSVRPPTFGDRLPDGTPAETVLTPADEQGCESCVDAILFWPEAGDGTASFRPVPGTCRTEAFRAQSSSSSACIPGTPCKRASDHLGWSLTCEIQGELNRSPAGTGSFRGKGKACKPADGRKPYPVFESRAGILWRRAMAGFSGAYGGFIALNQCCIIIWLCFVLPRPGRYFRTVVSDLMPSLAAGLLDITVHLAAVALHLAAAILALVILYYHPPLDSTLLYAFPASAVTAVLGAVAFLSV